MTSDVLRPAAKGGMISLLLLVSIGLGSCSREQASPQASAPAAPRIPAPREVAPEDWPAEKAKLADLAKQFPTAQALYDHFLQQANGGTKHTRLSVPDWKGWYTCAEPRCRRSDPDQTGEMPTAKLTPKYAALMEERVSRTREDRVSYDAHLTNCLPPGWPRSIVEPWGREFIATPGQTWIISELGNEVHRVYTDGRAQVRDADAERTFDGDTIGFWDGDALVAHTQHLVAGNNHPLQPDTSTEFQSVEIWRKANDTMYAYLWFYDPPVLAEPWFIRRRYKQDPNTDGLLRVRYYDCVGSKENAVDESPDEVATFKN